MAGAGKVANMKLLFDFFFKRCAGVGRLLCPLERPGQVSPSFTEVFQCIVQTDILEVGQIFSGNYCYAGDLFCHAAVTLPISF